jgi:hypothetical protein
MTYHHHKACEDVAEGTLAAAAVEVALRRNQLVRLLLVPQLVLEMLACLGRTIAVVDVGVAGDFIHMHVATRACRTRFDSEQIFAIWSR